MPNRRRPLFAETQFLSAVGTGRNTDLGATVNRRDFHFGAERSLWDGDRDNSEEIVAPAIEKWMRFHFHYDVEIAWRAAVQTDVAAAGDAHARTSLGSRRYAHVERFHARNASFAAAIAARR